MKGLWLVPALQNDFPWLETKPAAADFIKEGIELKKCYKKRRFFRQIAGFSVCMLISAVVCHKKVIDVAAPSMYNDAHEGRRD